jgi:hypothetical protein
MTLMIPAACTCHTATVMMSEVQQIFDRKFKVCYLKQIEVSSNQSAEESKK